MGLYNEINKELDGTRARKKESRCLWVLRIYLPPRRVAFVFWYMFDLEITHNA